MLIEAPQHVTFYVLQTRKKNHVFDQNDLLYLARQQVDFTYMKRERNL